MNTKIIAHTYILFLLSLFTCIPNIFADNKVAEISSPDNSIRFELFLDGEQSLYYQVNKNGETVLSKSQLGIHTSIADFTSGLAFITASSKAVDESYTLPSGKVKNYTDICNELTATFRKSGQEIKIVARAYNEGVAFRYVLEGTDNIAISSEQSECNINSINRIFAQTYSKDYKNITEEPDLDLLSCTGQRTSLPLLVKAKNNYLLLTEASVDGNYAASYLEVDEATQAFRYKPVSPTATSLPLHTPWRVLFIGSLNSMVESTMLENLNPATTITDNSWIKPGKAAWNYIGEDTFGYLSTENIYTYIDWVKEMGWEYFTLDRGWQNTSGFSLNKIIGYATSKGIGVFIWVNQQKLPTERTELQKLIAGWKSQGVKGLKVDFWEDDSQTMMKKYELLIQLAAEQKLLLNFHSCTKPSGQRRTWPHLLTTEAVLGNSYYAQSPAVISSMHNINEVILRSLLGPTDYAPVDFADKNGRILYGTTWAHQLALSVIFESGIQHITDSPDNLRYHISNGFLRQLPVTWDEIKCLEAEPETFISLARKKGEDWYIGSLTNEARNFETTLSFLKPDTRYNAYIYSDGDCSSEIKFDYREGLTFTQNISIPLAKNGGLTILISPSEDYTKPYQEKYEAEAPDNTIPFGISLKTDDDSLCSNRQYLASIGKGRSLTFRKIKVPKTATYAITFYYMANENRKAYVKINGKQEEEHFFIGTGKETGSGLAHKTILAELEANMENTLEFGNDSEYAPNLDRITVSGFNPDITSISPATRDETTIKIYTTDRNIIIANPSVTNYEVCNTIGQIIANGIFQSGSVSIPIREQGIYIVRVKAGNTDHKEKIIIH